MLGGTGFCESADASFPSRYASKTLRAMGDAAVDPNPAFSTSTEIAILGSSVGANAMNHACSRLRSSTSLCLVLSVCFTVTTCAVPVLPAHLYLAPAPATCAVPLGDTAPSIPSKTTLHCSSVAMLTGFVEVGPWGATLPRPG